LLSKLDRPRKDNETSQTPSQETIDDLFPLKIERDLQLKLLERKHAPELFKLVDANRTHLRRESHGGKTRVLMGMWSGESLAGVITYDYIDWSNRAVLIGFWLGKSFEGRGIVTRACSTLTDLAINELGMNRVEISCAYENTRCRSVPERLEFKQEGVSRQRERIREHFVDTVSYSMLASEWKNRTV
jgi:ribosomal-protein-serine acetyltransferase